MYGFSPGAFIMRRADDLQSYETIEGVWLAAWFDLYRDKVEQGEIFEVTQQGIATGQLFMSEEHVDEYRPKRWTKYRSFGASIQTFMGQKNSRDILKDLVEQITTDAVDSLAIPSKFLFKDEQSRTSLEELRRHELMIDTYPERSIQGDRLRILGVKV